MLLKTDLGIRSTQSSCRKTERRSLIFGASRFPELELPVGTRIAGRQRGRFVLPSRFDVSRERKSRGGGRRLYKGEVQATPAFRLLRVGADVFLTE
jgi:hypothetical protein